MFLSGRNEWKNFVTSQSLLCVVGFLKGVIFILKSSVCNLTIKF